MAMDLNIPQGNQFVSEDGAYSRRQLGQLASLLGAGVAFGGMFAPEAEAQQAAKAVLGAVRIGANECWTGPFPSGVAAASAIVAQGNRYDPSDEIGKLRSAVAKVEGFAEDHILIWPGSSDPLMRSVVSFCTPERGLVTADPTYEGAWRVAEWMGAPLSKVPMAPGKGADVRAMLAANPKAGLYYICSPNNPTGTVTSVADIEWLAAHKPTDAVLLVDEAYIHFSEIPSALGLAASRKDVLVMRTFSKLFGMAGMRLGLTFAHPELQDRMWRYDGKQVTNMLPITAVACGRAMYGERAQIARRRTEMIAARTKTVAFLTRNGIAVHPGSEANMIMVDWKTRPAVKMQAALLEQNVQIGRNWSIWPTVSRVTIGSGEDMDKFCAAVMKVIKA